MEVFSSSIISKVKLPSTDTLRSTRGTVLPKLSGCGIKVSTGGKPLGSKPRPIPSSLFVVLYSQSNSSSKERPETRDNLCESCDHTKLLLPAPKLSEIKVRSGNPGT